MALRIWSSVKNNLGGESNVHKHVLLQGSKSLPERCANACVFVQVRVDQPGADDNDEYIELIGPPGQSLCGLTLIIIGDIASIGGVLEESVSLPFSAMK